MMSQLGANDGPNPHMPESADHAEAATCVLRACHPALFPGAVLRCADTDLTGRRPVDAMIVFPDGSTATATYRHDGQGPQLIVGAHRRATGEQREHMTWSIHQAAPGVLRIRHLAQPTPS